jgi:hypothetical protein
LYYYYKERHGRTVRSTYGGCGLVATLAGRLDECERVRRIGLRDEARDARALDTLTARVCAALARAARALLLAHGYRRNRARAWTRRPMKDATLPANGPVRPAQNPLCDNVYSASNRERRAKDLKALVARAQEGDERAVGEIRALLIDDPDRFVRLGEGDLGPLAIDSVAFCLSHPKWHNRSGRGPFDGVRWFAITTRARQLLAELCPPGQDSPVERLLAERVVVTWVESNGFAIQAAERSDERWDQLAHRAAARHVAALRALAAVRRLDLGPLRVQVNVAGAQQVVNGAPGAAAVAGEDPGKPRPKQGRRALPG